MTDDHSSRKEEESAAPSVREVAILLFRRGRLFVSISGLVFALAIVYAFAGTTYRSHARILVRKGRADPPLSAQVNAPPDFSRVEVTEEELNSEVELLKGDDVLLAVAQANNLAAHDWLRWMRWHESAGARVERAAQRLGNRLKIEPIKKTNLIAVSYDSPDPQLAAHVLQSLTAIYLEKHMEVHRPGGQLHFFDEQTQESQRQLEAAQAKLLGFAHKHGIVMAAQQRDLVLQRIDQTDANYRQTQVEIAETARRFRELRGQMLVLPERNVTQIRSADNPELLKTLKAGLLDLELKRTQLLNKFEPAHRLVQEVEQQIAQTKDAIEKEELSPLRDQTTDLNVNYAWAQAELQKAQVGMRGLVARAKKTRAQLSQYRAQARHLGEEAIVQDDLTSSEKAAQENYLLYVKKREIARMGDALDDGGIVNVAIAERPMVPELPVWPASAVVLMGFVAAVTVGTGTAFAAEYMDPCLRTPEEVANCLQLPVLASLPARNSGRLSA
jgi:uncharacterized protein involved in exopolysaccharide biosynthesis